MTAKLDVLGHVATNGKEPASYTRPRKAEKVASHLDTPHFRMLETTLDLIDADTRVFGNAYQYDEMPVNRLLA